MLSRRTISMQQNGSSCRWTSSGTDLCCKAQRKHKDRWDHRRGNNRKRLQSQCPNKINGFLMATRRNCSLQMKLKYRRFLSTCYQINIALTGTKINLPNTILWLKSSKLSRTLRCTARTQIIKRKYPLAEVQLRSRRHVWRTKTSILITGVSSWMISDQKSRRLLTL